MRITSGGNVGIGTSSPAAKLDVAFTPSITREMLKFAGTTTVNDNFTLSNATTNDNVFVPIFQYKATTYGYGGGTNLYPSGVYGGGFIANVDDVSYPSGIGAGAAMHFNARNYANTGVLSNRYLFSFGNWLTTYMVMTAGGNVLINTTTNAGIRLDVNGSARAALSLAVGNITPSATVGRIDASNDVVAFSTSDARFKTNISPISSSLDKIQKISGVEFDWISDTKHGYEGHDVGVIAQELEKVLPEVVTTRDNGYKAVKYEKIVPLLIEAIKEQQKQIEELKQQIKPLV
jgi:hypothetical protein